MKRSLEAIFALALLYIFIEHILFLESLYAFALGLFLFMPFSSFVIAPFMRVERFFKTYSQILVVQFPTKKTYDLHLASNVDLILFARNSTNPRKMIFHEIVEGLLNICREIENGVLPRTVSIQAITFFVKKTTFQKLGFKTITFAPQYAILYFFDYIGILLSNYCITKRFRFVNILKTQKATMTGEDLLQNRGNLEQLKMKLSNEV